MVTDPRPPRKRARWPRGGSGGQALDPARYSW